MILDYSYDKIKAFCLTSMLTEDNLPIDPIKLIQNKYNVDLIFDDLEGEEGYTLYDKKRNRYRICIDESFRKTRCNFTIAHEVGHIVLNHFDNYDLEDPITHKELDKHANSFASAVLMPEHILKKFDFFSAEYIANAFCVSIEALSIRINYVDINII